MAIIIENRTKCAICRKRILKGQAYIAFPGFVSNLLDEIHFASDAAFHRICFERHEHCQIVMDRFEEYEFHFFGKRFDIITGKEIIMKEVGHPDNYFFFGHLVSSPEEYLFQFNYAHVNLKNLSSWKERENVIAHLKSLDQRPDWAGPHLKSLIFALRRGPVPDLPKSTIERLEDYIRKFEAD